MYRMERNLLTKLDNVYFVKMLGIQAYTLKRFMTQDYSLLAIFRLCPSGPLHN